MEHVETFAGGATLLYSGWVARSWWINDIRALSFQHLVSLAAGSLLFVCLIYQIGILRGATIVSADINIQISQLSEIIHERFGPAPHTSAHDDAVQKETATLIGNLLLPVWLMFDLFIVWGAGTVTNWRRLRPTRYPYNSGSESEKTDYKRSGADPK